MTEFYTYLVVHKPSQKFYYGVKYGKGSLIKDLWSNYFTSSKVIHKMISLEGKDVFEYEIRHVFKDADSAINWEKKVLTKFINHSKCINLNCGGAIKYTPEVRRKISNKRSQYIKENPYTKEQNLANSLRCKLYYKNNPEAGKAEAIKRKEWRRQNPFNESDREKISKGLKGYYLSNPCLVERGQNISKGLKRWNSANPKTEEQNLANSLRLKAYYQNDPTARQKNSEAQLKYHKNNPDVAKQFGLNMKRWYKNNPMSVSEIERRSKNIMGRKRFNDGINNKLFFPDNVPEGFVPGFTYSTRGKAK